jgi:hypothetical protein
MLFHASEFADVSGQWGILFSVWQRGQDDRTEWTVALKRSSEDLENPVETFGEKVLYNLDGKVPASKWVRQEIKGMKTHDAPQIASALKVKQNGRGASVSEHVGYLVSVADNVYKSSTDVFIVSECSSTANGLSVIPANFRKVCSLFTARRTITGKYVTWVNQKDEYIAPNEQHPDYSQWNTDAIVYSLFNTASNQSSLRNISYKGKTYQIHNEWFWLSRKAILDLANKHHNDAVYQDARTDKDRFVYTTLQSTSLSPDAKAVLDKATELLEKTFEYREMAADEHPEWCIQTWDASWYQVKLLLKQYLPADLKAFQVLYRQLEDRLREGVYDLGFLRR